MQRLLTFFVFVRVLTQPVAVVCAGLSLSACATHQANAPGVTHYFGYVRFESPTGTGADNVTRTSLLGARVGPAGIEVGWLSTALAQLQPGCRVVVMPSSPGHFTDADKAFLRQLTQPIDGSILCTPLDR